MSHHTPTHTETLGDHVYDHKNCWVPPYTGDSHSHHSEPLDLSLGGNHGSITTHPLPYHTIPFDLIANPGGIVTQLLPHPGGHVSPFYVD